MASILELIGTRRGHGTTAPGGLSLGEQLVVHFVELAAAEGSRHLLLRIGASAAEVQHTTDFVNRVGFTQRGGWWWRPIEGIALTESPDS
ncbi:hypothetical protein ACFQV2_39860 [Actinokineospora soli]|uniref:Uncharacterized protein n=1 Tax=Actinokineospora soli TaxID=1048753 RepID=A0ABW2TZB4_9PSEU